MKNDDIRYESNGVPGRKEAAVEDFKDSREARADDGFRELFGSFNPELPSSVRFMSRLEERLEEVELVRRHNLEQQRRGRRAVVAASVVGFFSGVLCMMAMPAVTSLLSRLGESLGTLLAASGIPTLSGLPEVYTTAAWALSACATLAATFLTYDLMLGWRRHALQ